MHLKKPAKLFVSVLKIGTENEKNQNTFRYLAKKKVNSRFKCKKHITQKATTCNETYM